MVYTSGTTGNPKGVVHKHGSLQAQMDSLSAAWKYESSDRILNVLPLHHVHGIVNVFNTSLWNGSTIEMLPGSFDAGKTWKALLRSDDPFSVFMAVPTVYNILAKYIKDGKLRDTYSDE